MFCGLFRSSKTAKRLNAVDRNIHSINSYVLCGQRTGIGNCQADTIFYIFEAVVVFDWLL